MAIVCVMMRILMMRGGEEQDGTSVIWSVNCAARTFPRAMSFLGRLMVPFFGVLGVSGVWVVQQACRITAARDESAYGH